MDANRLWRIIRFHWMYAVLGLILGVTAGASLAWMTPPEYSARADVFVAVTGSSTTGELAQGSSFSQQQARNFSAVTTREIVLEPVIEELGLNLKTAELRSKVSASVQLNTSVISIQATDASAAQSARIANLVATNLARIVPTLSPQVDGASPVRLRVIETAAAPVIPSSPNTAMLIVLGALAGLLLGAVVIVIRLLIGTRISTAEAAAEATGGEVIGTITFDRTAPRAPLALRSDMHSLRAEQYRQLRANLRFLQTSQQHRVFVLTSSTSGEGKSTVAANAALALAASKLSVLLIEADLRRPTLARVLDLPPELGLTNVIAGDVKVDDALIPYGPDRLDVLLAGDLPPNPSELLESSSTVELLDELRAGYDVVIIDGPPLNPVADAAVLAGLFGGVIFVVGARRVRARDVRRAVQRLDTVGATVQGVVLNLAPGSLSERHRYSAYSAASPGRGASDGA
jgi:succinoglycan biosynthesis transport protein ExoP